jgi:putative spermidine/putrescine transport system substrate-binding protein
MKRRDLMKLGLAGLAAPALVRPAFAQAATLNMYTNSDANISDFWSNTIKPAFERANPGVSINVVIAREGGGTMAIAERALAALNTGAGPQLDIIEQHDPFLPAGGIDAGLWTDWTAAGLQNYGNVNPLAIQSAFGLPYRGSQVLLAYDTTKLSPADAPSTWAELTDWIKANPGQFIYNRPDKGGSGGNFVRRAIHEANGRDPSLFTVANFEAAKAETMLGGGFALLADLAPHLFDGGAYASGNANAIQLLAQGAVTMIPAWSDMALQAINQGVLPETTGLVQLQDLALAGGFSQSVVPTNAENHEMAVRLADFLLTPEMQSAVITQIGGFPGTTWDILPAELREKYAAVVPASIPTFPGGDWGAAVSDGWYRNVAPNVPRD